MIEFSPEIKRLYDAYVINSTEAAARHGRTIYFVDDELTAFAEARLLAYQETVGLPAILRRTRMMELFAEKAIVRCDAGDIFAGSQKFCSFGFPPEINDELYELGYAHNPGHIVHNYAALLDNGIAGLVDKITVRLKDELIEEEALNLNSFLRALQAFKKFVNRYTLAMLEMVNSTDDSANALKTAMSLKRLGQGEKPVTFHEALQMVWFMQIFLHAENPSAAISFGRIDQCLWPFLRDDIKSKIINMKDAANMVAAFYLRCCEGEESQNLTLGGVDSEGEDATNPLSILMLQVMQELRVTQPSLSVRIHENTPQEFIDEACKLAATGTGQPGFINDNAAISGLQVAGIPLERARDYGIVGCYEATPQGDCYPNTVGGSVPTLPKLLNKFINTTEAQNTPDFQSFINGWYSYVDTIYQQAVKTDFQNVWNHWRDMAPSSFSSVFTDGCIERAKPLEAGGANYNLFGVNMLGLGTTIDSLHAINEMVFESKALTLTELAAAIINEFPDETLRRKLSVITGKYGTDNAVTNKLAAEISSRIARMVLDSKMENDVQPYPAFFRFTADIHDHPYATPDGRRKADNLSYGCGPSSGCGGTPTSILASASNVAHYLCGCGNLLALSLPAESMSGDDGIATLKSLVKGYFASSGFHLHFNLQSAETLRTAKADPANNADVTIRISGLSAKFVTLNENLQDALIERAEKGT